MTNPFSQHKAYTQMDAWQRGVLVWLDHMKSKGRDVITSLRAQTATPVEFDKVKETVDSVANAYPAWPQSKWYLDESSEKLVNAE